MSGRVITAGDQTFRPRKETYSVILAREEQAAREGDLRDVVNGYATQITHAMNPLNESPQMRATAALRPMVASKPGSL